MVTESPQQMTLSLIYRIIFVNNHLAEFTWLGPSDRILKVTVISIPSNFVFYVSVKYH